MQQIDEGLDLIQDPFKFELKGFTVSGMSQSDQSLAVGCQDMISRQQLDSHISGPGRAELFQVDPDRALGTGRIENEEEVTDDVATCEFMCEPQASQSLDWGEEDWRGVHAKRASDAWLFARGSNPSDRSGPMKGTDGWPS